MEEKKEILNLENIRNRVYFIRGQQVMLDYDLADIYGYEVKRLNEQVKRNIARFPVDFMFQLSEYELENLRSQNIMLRAVRSLTPLQSKESICWQLFFVVSLQNNKAYIISEMSIQVASVSDRQKKTDRNVENIQKSIDTLSENFISDKDYKNFVIYKGQKFEADVAYIDIYQQATASIYVVDDYVNTKTLQLLSQKKQGVEVILFTENGHSRDGFLTQAVVDDFKSQYPTLHIKPNPDCHDRLIVIDYGFETEQVYHCGASSKDAGRKLCAINKIEDSTMIHPV